MSAILNNKIAKEIGIEKVTVLNTSNNERFVIIGLVLVNLTEFPIYASINIVDDTSTEVFYIKEVLIPADSSLKAVNAGDKLVLSPNNQLLINSDQPESIDATISYLTLL